MKLGTLERLSKRERLIGLVAVMCLILISWQMLVTDPLMEKRKLMKEQLAVDKQLKIDAEAHLIALQVESTREAGHQSPEVLAELQAKNAVADIMINDIRGALTGKEAMVVVLRDLFASQHDVTLLRFKTENVEAITTQIISSPTAESTTNHGAKTSVSRSGPGERFAERQPVKEETGLYRHRFSLQFEGDHDKIVTYLKAIEQMQWTLYWRSIDYQVKNAPAVAVTLLIETVSVGSEWLEL